MERFKPDVRSIEYNGLPKPAIGSIIDVTPVFLGSAPGKYKLTDQPPYRAPVIIAGDVSASVCRSQSKENCPLCTFPPKSCEAPIK